MLFIESAQTIHSWDTTHGLLQTLILTQTLFVKYPSRVCKYFTNLVISFLVLFTLLYYITSSQVHSNVWRLLALGSQPFISLAAPFLTPCIYIYYIVCRCYELKEWVSSCPAKGKNIRKLLILKIGSNLSDNSVSHQTLHFILKSMTCILSFLFSNPLQKLMPLFTDSWSMSSSWKLLSLSLCPRIAVLPCQKLQVRQDRIYAQHQQCIVICTFGVNDQIFLKSVSFLFCNWLIVNDHPPCLQQILPQSVGCNRR